MRTKMFALPVLVTTAALALAGCVSGSGGGSDSVTFIQGISGDPFYETMACGARAEAEKLGLKLDVQGAQSWDVSLQTPLVDSVVQARPAVMFIAPNDADGMIGPLRAASEAGIKVGLVDTTLSNTDNVSFGIATDNVKAGEAAADALAKLIGEKGSVLVAGLVPGVSTSEDRAKGFIQQIKKYPNINYVGDVFTNNGGVSGISALVGAKISSTPDLAGVFAMAGDQSQGTANAIQSAGRVGTIKVVGFDAGPTQVEQLRNGVVQALVAQDPSEIGRKAVEDANALIKDQKVEAKTGAPSAVITADNVDDPNTKQYLYTDTCG